MKKICFCVFLILLIYRSIGYAGVEETWQTDGVFNGRFIVYSLIEKNGGEKGEEIANYYLMGIFHAIQEMYPKFLETKYPKATPGDIVEAIKQYYQNNPLQRDKKIIDVILEGYKS